MELRHLRYFVAVAEKLNFTEAARSVHIAQPSLSQQIQDLEKHVGVTLIERNNRHVKLTPAGDNFLKDARRILQQADEAKSSAIKIDRGELGECRIGFLFPAVRHGMVTIINQFHQQFPNVRLRMGHYSPAEQIKMLDEGLLDIAFTRTYNLRAYPHFAVDVITNDTLMAVVHPDHPLAIQDYIGLSQLSNQKIIMFSRELAPTFFDTVAGFCGAGQVDINVQHREPYVMDTIVLMVESGMGIGIVPGSIAHLRDSKCRFLPFDVPPPPIELLMVRHKDSVSNPVIQSFVDIAMAHRDSF